MPSSRIFILGAGFSKQYSTAAHGVPNLEPPTDGDFFKQVKRVLDNSNYESSREELEILFQYICDSWKIEYDETLDFLNSPVLKSMEEVFTDLSIKTSLFESKIESDVFSKYLETMKELTAYVIGRSLYGTIDPQILDLVSEFNNDDLIVIFNYELLIEKALESTGRFSCSGYNINPYKRYIGDSWHPINDTASLEIIKVHGSINWGRCMECDTLMILDENIYLSPDFECKKIKELGCPRCNQSGSISRVIVPPIQTKSYDDNPIRFLWRKTAREINSVNSIISLGYSLPKTDFSTRTLLRIIQQNKTEEELSKLKLITMNRTSTAEQEYQKLLPIKRENSQRCKNIPELLDLL